METSIERKEQRWVDKRKTRLDRKMRRGNVKGTRGGKHGWMWKGAEERTVAKLKRKENEGQKRSRWRNGEMIKMKK